MAEIDIYRILQPERMKAFGLINDHDPIDFDISRVGLFIRFDDAIPTIGRMISTMFRDSKLHNVFME